MTKYRIVYFHDRANQEFEEVVDAATPKEAWTKLFEPDEMEPALGIKQVLPGQDEDFPGQSGGAEVDNRVALDVLGAHRTDSLAGSCPNLDPDSLLANLRVLDHFPTSRYRCLSWCPLSQVYIIDRVLVNPGLGELFEGAPIGVSQDDEPHNFL